MVLDPGRAGERGPAGAAGASITVHAGQDLADQLQDRHVLGWHRTDERDAERGLADGRYHLILRIPADLSADLAGAPDPAKTPTSGGFTDLRARTQQAADGAGQLAGGAHRLAGGLSSLQSGAQQLASGLADGAARIPGYDRDGIAPRAGVLADPVDPQRQVRKPAGTYGVGFAPYFVSLALWVGAMITYVLLRPVNLRHVLSGARASRVALAGWLPAVAVGVAQALLLFAVLYLALGLRPVHPVATVGYLLLAALAFTALIQWLGARLGPSGRPAALALLML